MKGYVFLADDHLVLDFPYDAAQVAEIKKIPGSKWDKVSKVWRVPVSSLDQVRGFGAEHGFIIDPEVLRFDLPKVKPEDVPEGLSIDGDNVSLYFDYDVVKVRLVKKIPGVTWKSKTKAWIAPMSSLPQAIEWAESFGLDVSDEIRAIADAEKSRTEEMLTASKQTDAELNIETLQGMPFPYQKAGIRYVLSALNQVNFRKGVIIGDQPGLGKTVQSLGVLESTNAYPAVVICPATLKLNWQKEIQRWLPHRTTQILSGKTPCDINADIAIINYDVLTGWVEKFRGYRGIVMDESHYCKSPQAARTKAALKLSKRIVEPTAVRLCLTGTPVTNRPAELATQLDFIGRLNDFGGYMGYYRTFCGAFRDRWGHWQTGGASNLDILNERLRANCYVRRTKDQVLPELPAVIHSPVEVDMTPAGAKEYAKAEADIIEYLMERAREIALELGESPNSAAVRAKMRAEANQHLVRISVLRRIAAKAKMPAIIEWVESRVEAGNKVVIAAHHRNIVDELASRFGGLKIQGQMTVEEVEENKRMFQELPVSEAPVIVLSIQAAKTGHTLTAAQDILFVELPWTPADVDQTYGRLHRIGQKGSVNATYMLASGSIDRKIYDLIEEKRSVVDALTDGTDGEETDSIANALVSLFSERAFD